MTPEEQAAAAAAAKAEKAKKDTASDVISVRSIYNGYAAKATEDKPYEVNIVKNINVEFTQDFGKHIKKGQKQSISQVAYDFYKGHGVVKLVKKTAETEE